MPFMRNIASGAVVGPMVDDGAEFRYLQALRDGSGVHPLWEQVPVETAEAAGVLVDGKAANTVQALSPAAAAGADAKITVGKAPYAGVVASITYYPNAAVVGADTNSRTFNGLNGGQAGSGSTNVAAKAMVAAAGTAAANQPLDITVNATPANLVVASGDIIDFQSLHVGTGIADPGGLVVVTFTRE